MSLILKLAGWLMVGLTPIFGVMATAGSVTEGGTFDPGQLLAVWTVLPVFITGVMFTVFGQLVAHLSSIDQAMTAQYLLLDGYRRERALEVTPQPRLNCH